MTNTRSICLYGIGLIFSSIITCQAVERDTNLTLWYNKPADEWMKSVPLGNGRLGAMVYGGLEAETIALNEITMWSGQPDPDQEIACGKEKLDQIRQLFFEGKLEEGNQLASQYLSGQPHSFGSHLPIGDLKITFGHKAEDVSGYHRELNLENAVSSVTYQIKDINYYREYICSNPDDALVMRFYADKGRSISLKAGLELIQDAKIKVSGNELEFTGQALFPRQGPGGVDFIGKIRFIPKGGTIRSGKDHISIENADEVVIISDIRTNFNNTKYKELCSQTVKTVSDRSYTSIKEDHIKDYSNLFNRVSLSFGKDEKDNLATNTRWQQKREGAKDTGLDALFFQYGRYLLISGSRENSPLPANLQGIWNDNLANNMGWTCDYHLDINTQQNYWAANVTNLHECNTPLFNYLKDLSEYGEKTAMKVYGSPGWVAHTVANIWGYTAPGQSVNWGLHPTGGAWLATHLWTHYTFTQDKEFLRREAYPILKKAADFFLDYMVEDPKFGYLMTGPSTSPENSFLYNGVELSLSMMPTCDRVLVYETFMSCVEASRILGIDETYRNKLETALSKLPPFQIGRAGTIQEWFCDFDLAHPNHRHSSHLLALYPFNQISIVQTPDLAKAAAQSIHNQLHAENWEDVEWSRANMINFYARLKDPQKAYNSLTTLQQDFARENLLTISPEGIAGAPYDIFIFDGNEAGISGMAEMLIQSQEGYIELLPALPEEWNTGSFKGLCVRGGGTVDLNWNKGKITQMKLSATQDNSFSVLLPENCPNPEITVNNRIVEPQSRKENTLTFALKQGDILKWDFKLQTSNF